MCLTNGSLYALNDVFYIDKEGKKPSLKALSDIYELPNHRKIRKGVLGGYDWSSVFVNYNGDFEKLGLDRLVKEEIDNFWAVSNIKFASEIEHKPEHLSIKRSDFGKGNYALKTFNHDKGDWSNTFSKSGDKRKNVMVLEIPSLFFWIIF